MGEDGSVTVGTGSAPALERYAVRLRRERLWYAAAIAVLVVAASVVTAVVWLSGEISHTTLHTVAKAPPDVPTGTFSATQHKVWSSTDTAAAGTPNSGGTVVTFDTHTVRGRDALTGAQTWYYKRTDRTVCTAMQVGGVTVAVYRLNGNCDEITGLDSGTGKREWTRTLDLDTHQLNGVPQFSISGGTVMFVSPGVIYALNSSDGYDAWLFAEAGCTVQRAVLGVSGALISQTCAHRDCTQVKHCLNGQQLVLRDPATGENTDSSKNNGNPDQIYWAKNYDMVPASAGATISAYSRDGSSLSVFDSKLGKITSTVSLKTTTAPAAPSASSTDTALTDADVIFSAGTTYVLGGGVSPHILWSQASAIAPTVTSGATGLSPTLDSAQFVRAGPHGIDVLDPRTGALTATYPLTSAPSSTAQIYPLGTGFVVADHGVAVYQ